MTKLEELQTDLASHKDAVKRFENPEYAAYLLKFKKVNVQLIMPSYKKIIKSIEDEIKTIQVKKK